MPAGNGYINKGRKQSGGAEPVLVRVALPVPGREHGVFQYCVPKDLEGQVVIGAGVIVPLGRRRVNGYIIGFDSEPVSGVRAILKIAGHPPLQPRLMALAFWMSTRYLCLVYHTLRLMAPPVGSGGTLVTADMDPERVCGVIRSFRYPSEVEEQLLDLVPVCSAAGAALSDCLSRLDHSGRLAFRTLLREGVFMAERLQERKETTRVVPHLEVLPGVDSQRIDCLRADGFLTQRQSEVIHRLIPASSGTVTRLAAQASCSPALIQTLAAKGLLIPGEAAAAGGVSGGSSPSCNENAKLEIPPQPVEDQARAIDAIAGALRGRTYAAFLLHGITGSGKTEVYLRSMALAADQGRQALMIVPEIALTPQLVKRVKARFGERVAVLHSALSPSARRAEWYRIHKGQAVMVVGARSALFAPLPSPGLIVLDEEHETSYKQEDSPRYHAREIAEHLAREAGAVLVCGSATPSVETYYRAVTGEYCLLPMPARIGARALPGTVIVDMREELKRGNRTVFSRALQDGMTETLNRGEQTILFLNRRGHSTFVLCRECGYVCKCPHCDVSLTYHAAGNRLVCHYCGFGRISPDTCPHCQSRAIRFFGTGTQKVEQELKSLFPSARVARMDVDTTSTRGSHTRIYEAMASGGIDILIGTQMVAKGLDIPGVTLVGIVSADTALHLPDFRSGERTFQLITQASGRAGRGHRPGQVILQTYNPHHYSVVAGSRQDYPSFYEQEISLRQECGYPPFSTLAKIEACGPDARAVETFINLWVSEFRRQCAGVNTDSSGQVTCEAYGPAPAPIARVQNRFRYQVVVRVPAALDLSSMLQKVGEHMKQPPRGTTLIVDINPYSIV